MIRILIVATAVVAALATDLRRAEAREAPWCAVIHLGGASTYWDCQYRSLQACQPDVLAGNRGFCIQNPAYNGASAKKYRKHGATRH